MTTNPLALAPYYNEWCLTMMDQYYSDNELADLLGISLSRLRGKIYQGEPLPARIQVPGSRTRLWRKQDVHDWLAQFRTEDSLFETTRHGRKLKR